jgi:uncharacterized protein CbrC (UPF0167 family)
MRNKSISIDLPIFKYHPDPIRSGSLVKSKKKCECCKKARGYIYAGPTYCEDDFEEALCPWCIGDGSAHAKYDATFVDEAVFPDDVPPAVVEEIACRTPAYSAWQSEQWFSCCRDAMAFLEPVGAAEIRERYPQIENDLLAYIVSELGLSRGDATMMLESLRRDAGPTAYVFQCLHCGAFKTFVDGIFDIEA